MIGLWIAAALVSAGAAALIMLRAAGGARRRADSGPELAVYQRQMAEIETLADRGLLAEAERRSVRAETGRRLLAAAHRPDRALSFSGPRLLFGLAALAPILAAAVYVAIGAPGFADQPFARRLAEWRSADPATLTAPQMAAVLRAVAAEQPTKPEPLRMLALAELASDQPMEAVQALERAISIDPRRADLWEGLGEAEIAATNGNIGAEAQQAFRQALALSPGDVDARYYLARARIAGGDIAGGLAAWRAIASTMPANDARRPPLLAEIGQVATTGALPAALSDRSQAQPQVGPEQIQAMVDGLAARLKGNPDDPAGWARLVRAYTVLGETGQRDAALAEARRRYAGRPDVLAQLRDATQPP